MSNDVIEHTPFNRDIGKITYIIEAYDGLEVYKEVYERMFAKMYLLLIFYYRIDYFFYKFHYNF